MWPSVQFTNRFGRIQRNGPGGLVYGAPSDGGEEMARTRMSCAHLGDRELPSLQAPAAIAFYDSMLLMTPYDVGVQQCNSPRLAS
jgi:hypothetical protein